MTWEQKLLAFSGLTETSLKLLEIDYWYVSLIRTCIKDGTVTGSYVCTGKSPEQAVLNTWDNLVTNFPAGCYIVINQYRDDRKAVRWNGHMWADVDEDKR